MIIVKSQIDNAVQVLAKPADGSQANEQARTRAQEVIRQHVTRLEAFASINPASRPAQAISVTVAFYNSILEA